MQDMQSSQNKLEKEEQSWKNPTSQFQNVLQSCNNQDFGFGHEDGRVAQGTITEPRNKPLHLWTIDSWQGCQDNWMGERTVFSITDPETTVYPKQVVS